MRQRNLPLIFLGSNMGNYNYAHVRFPSPSSPYVFLTNLTHDRGIYKTIGQEATNLF
jgi:hypothetical protein